MQNQRPKFVFVLQILVPKILGYNGNSFSPLLGKKLIPSDILELDKNKLPQLFKYWIMLFSG